MEASRQSKKGGGGDSPPNSRDEKFGNYGQSSTKYSQLKIFQSVNIFFAKCNSFFQYGNFFFTRKISSRRLRGARLPMSLGSSASFRRIVPFRDTSTTESEIPSFRDAKPKQSVLAPRHCEERSDVAILAAGKDCFYTSSITPLR